jgi:hypothetical protein
MQITLNWLQMFFYNYLLGNEYKYQYYKIDYYNNN